MSGDGAGWSPVGATANVLWCIDSNGNESAVRSCRSCTTPGVWFWRVGHHLDTGGCGADRGLSLLWLSCHLARLTCTSGDYGCMVFWLAWLVKTAMGGDCPKKNPSAINPDLVPCSNPIMLNYVWRINNEECIQQKIDSCIPSIIHTVSGCSYNHSGPISTPEPFKSTVPQTTQMTAAEQLIASNNKQTKINYVATNLLSKVSLTYCKCKHVVRDLVYRMVIVLTNFKLKTDGIQWSRCQNFLSRLFRK